MILGIIQARMSSTRLPGKVMKPLLGKPALARQLERLGHLKNADKVIVATSTGAEDDVIVDLCRQLAVDCFRGSLDDVLDRYYQAAKPHEPAHVLRVTSDCPLGDWRVIDAMITQHLEGGFDYTSNGLTRRFPDGQDAEIMTFATLEKLWREAEEPDHREHVSLFIYHHRDQFRLGHHVQDEDLSKLRWTLDWPKDYDLIKAVYEGLYPNNPDFTWQEALDYLLDHPEVRALNADDEALALYDRLERDRFKLN